VPNQCEPNVLWQVAVEGDFTFAIVMDKSKEAK